MSQSKNFCNISIIDATMGAGKTSWAIQYINECQDENILYITPFLDECNRVAEATNRDFKQPLHNGNGKLYSLNELLSCQEDIVSTHQLFKHIDDTTKNHIAENNYTLILDEVLNVVEPYPIKKDDLRILKNSDCITIDNEGFIIWNQDKYGYDTTFNEIKKLSENKSLLCINDQLLLWRYPPDVFRLFDKIYVLTYLFESSILKYYLELNHLKYIKKSIKYINNKYEICAYYPPDITKYRNLINIYESNLNTNIPQKYTSLSATWFDAKHNKEHVKQLQRNIYNYFSAKLSAKSESILWTTFKKAKGRLQGKGYSKGFISCNCRSTNDYADRYNIAYVLNIYLHPTILQYFKQHNIDIDQDLYALSEMLQLLWRSRIRNGKAINLYIPSRRMRELLQSWMRQSISDTNKIPS